MPLVSVIIPVYNVAPWLSECVDSVINQTYNNLEILLIDDGSTDGSGEICDNYSQLDRRITVLHTDHHGLSAARNNGLDHATGDIIFFLDSDDVAYPNAIERVVAVMEQTAAQIIAFGTSREGFYNRTDVLRSMISKNGIAGAIWTKVFRSDVLNDIRFRENHNYSDVAFFLNAFDKCGKLYAITDKLIKYRYRPGSITASNTVSNRLDAVEQNIWLYDYAKSRDSEVIEKLRLRIIKSKLASYYYLYNDQTPKSKAIKKTFQEEIIRALPSIPLREWKLKSAAMLFKFSPRLFVGLYKPIDVIKKMNRLIENKV